MPPDVLEVTTNSTEENETQRENECGRHGQGVEGLNEPILQSGGWV